MFPLENKSIEIFTQLVPLSVRMSEDKKL